MPSVTGNLKFITNVAAYTSVAFTPRFTPQAQGSSVMISKAAYTVTDSNGDIAATTLVYGNYLVTLGNGEKFYITVPNGAGPYALADIVDATASTVDTSTYIRRLYIATASATATAASATSIVGSGVGSLSVSASFFAAGKSVRLRWSGTITTTASPGTLSLISGLSGNLESEVVVTPYASHSANRIEFESLITCRTAGVGGTVAISTVATVFNPAGDGTSKRFASFDTDDLDTTATHIITAKAQWSGAGQSLTMQQLIAEVVQ